MRVGDLVPPSSCKAYTYLFPKKPVQKIEVSSSKKVMQSEQKIATEKYYFYITYRYYYVIVMYEYFNTIIKILA